MLQASLHLSFAHRLYILGLRLAHIIILNSSQGVVSMCIHRIIVVDFRALQTTIQDEVPSPIVGQYSIIMPITPDIETWYSSRHVISVVHTTQACATQSVFGALFRA